MSGIVQTKHTLEFNQVKHMKHYSSIHVHDHFQLQCCDLIIVNALLNH